MDEPPNHPWGLLLLVGAVGLVLFVLTLVWVLQAIDGH